MCGRVGVSSGLDLHEDLDAAIADKEVVEEPFLKLRRVEGSDDGATPNFGVVG